MLPNFNCIALFMFYVMFNVFVFFWNSITQIFSKRVVSSKFFFVSACFGCKVRFVSDQRGIGIGYKQEFNK